MPKKTSPYYQPPEKVALPVEQEVVETVEKTEDEEIKRLKKELEKAQKANAGLEKKLDEAQKANAALEKKYEDAQKAEANSKKELEKAQKARDEYLTANKELQKDLKSATDTVVARDEQIAELKAAHDNTSAALDASNAKVCELKAKMTSVQPACQVGTDASAKEKLKQYREVLSYLSSAEKKELLDCLSIKADCSDKVEEIIKGRDDIDLRLAKQL